MCSNLFFGSCILVFFLHFFFVLFAAPPACRQAGQPMSSAECLMHGAAHAS